MNLSFNTPVRIILCVAFVSVLAGNSFGVEVAPRDNVIADDQIVQGSLAVGLDAVNNESFGFHTIRLKENNCRLAFVDTSVGAFPNVCWTLVANDTASGGANFFAIRDEGPNPGLSGGEGSNYTFKVMAGAPVNALFVGSDGKLGLKTGTPILDIHTLSGDTPAIRLEQDNTKGFTPQTWDIAGNEANFFVRDVTGGSLLPFRIRPGAPTSSIDISATGNVGIGTASPTATLHVNGTVFISQTIEVGSSRTRKENIKDLKLDDALATLKDLKPVQFNYKMDTQPQMGFIAEDVPDLVATKNRNSIIPMDFVAILTKVVQDHERREQELRGTVEAQKTQLKSLEARLEAMEKLLQKSVK